MISVIIPTYNRASLIGFTIESLLAQTLLPSEIIVIDDGSTDNTAEVVARFGDQVRYVRQENKERAVARNHGLGLAKGEYIIFLDSDDCLVPTALAELRAALTDNPNLACAAAGCDIVDTKGKVVQQFFPAGGASGILPDAFPQLVCSNMIGSPSCVLLRRQALVESGGFDEDRRLIGVEDWEVWARISYNHSMVCLNKPLVRYRRHEGNSPLAGMRLRYGWLLDALLRKLPLQKVEKSQMISWGTERLRGYALEFHKLGHKDGCLHCLAEVKRLESFKDGKKTPPENKSGPGTPNLPQGFTTIISSKEELSLSNAFHQAYRKALADVERSWPPVGE